MNKKTILSILLLCIVAFSTVQAKPKMKSVYMFGFSASFTDSIAYITDIQLLDSVYIDSKTGFLYDRPIYSQQLQSFVEQEFSRPNTTCVVFFSKKKSKIERKYLYVRKFYRIKKDDITLKPLDANTFKFTAEPWVEREETAEVDETPKNKKGRKGSKDMKPEGNMPGGMPPSGGMRPGGMGGAGGMGPGGGMGPM